MKDLRKIGIAALCSFGKFGLGKSITLGMYDFEVPAQLMIAVNQKSEHKIEKERDDNYLIH
jgi:hypothetical protein